jgi:DNA modification methylase
LDSYSGTTSTVARALGRCSIGIEINPQYTASAFQRIQQGPVHIGLFGEATVARKVAPE